MDNIKRRKKIFSRILFYAVASLIVFLFLIPIAWIFLTSVKPHGDWMSHPPVWITESPTLKNFTKVLTESSGSLYNSLIIVLTSSVIALFVGAMGSYSLSRFRVGGKNLPMTILSAYFLPPIIFAVPFLIIFKNLGIIDTRRGLILIYTAFDLPLVVWIMKQFFDEIPREIEEMSMIDGCSWWGRFFRISLRLAAPGLVTSFLLITMLSWSEYCLALALTGRKAMTIPVRFYLYWDEHTLIQWGPQAALSVVSIAPLLVIVLVIQKYLVRGLTFGAIK